jgi:hypothetical protein
LYLCKSFLKDILLKTENEAGSIDANFIGIIDIENNNIKIINL